MTSPLLLSYPSPTWLLVLGSQSREVWGRGMGGELVMSPILCVIGCGVAKTSTNQQSEKVWRGRAERPVATGMRESVR